MVDNGKMDRTNQSEKNYYQSETLYFGEVYYSEELEIEGKVENRLLS